MDLQRLPGHGQPRFPGVDGRASQRLQPLENRDVEPLQDVRRMWGPKNYQNVFIFKKIQYMFVFVASVPIEKQHNPLVFGEALCAKLRDENILQVVQHDGGVAMH